MFCMECGNEISVGAKFCNQCGKNSVGSLAENDIKSGGVFSEQSKAKEQVNISSEKGSNYPFELNEQFINSPKFDLMLGKKSSYYRSHFVRLSAVLTGVETKSFWEKIRADWKANGVGFNWAAAFFGFFWLAYRRMYLSAFMLFVIETYMGYKSKNIWVPQMVIFILLGVTGNKTYLSYLKKKLPKCKDDSDLVMLGSSSVLAACLSVGASILIALALGGN